MTSPSDTSAPHPVRIAMWSGPRNLSTALMRSWGSRADTTVVDEPLYAHYLATTGLDHPGRTEIMASQPTDWRTVAEQLLGPVLGGAPIYYQKHMAHHLLPSVERTWLDAPSFRHVFLLREPAAMLASLVKVLGLDVRVEDTGLPQQVELFQRIAERDGSPPPVVSARDILANPPAMLRMLCQALGVSYDAAMLSWEPGPRPTDGVWAKHWYAAVERSTGFGPPRAETALPPPGCAPILTECERYYAELVAFSLRP
ncbi:MAG: HAD family hydrolase [Bacteroidota bacterium]